MKQMSIQLETLTCPSCVKKIETSLGSLKGVNEVKVLFSSSKVKINFDESITSIEAINQTIDKVGFDVLSYK
jgi:copper chaperone